MRQSLLSTLQKAEPADNQKTPKLRDALLELRIPLRTTTKTIGGGVDTRQPDRIDVVRIPGIRGQLRHWWRLVDDDGNNPLLSEQRFFGGASPEDAQKSGSEASSSAGVISVQAEIVKEGSVAPAGFHVAKQPGGPLGALPQWSGDRALGYALFPLQRPREELRRAKEDRRSRLETFPIREGLEFDLIVRIENRNAGVLESDIDRFLRALWAFVHFGGIGARTTRGFGALAVRGPIQISGARWDEPKRTQWIERFQAPPADPRQLRAWLSDATTWGAFANLHILAGRPEPSAESAQTRLIAALKEFRQGLGVGRQKGRTGREGESNWPEAHAFRLMAEQQSGRRFEWEHTPPRPEKHRYRMDAGWYLPRAAFGLPIEISFKFTDEVDNNANGRITNSTERWQSPLILCTLACSDGRCYLPVAIYNPAAALSTDKEGCWVDLKIDKSSKEKRVRDTRVTTQVSTKDTGAKAPIKSALDGAEGSAIDAFLYRLAEQAGFIAVLGPEQQS